MDHIEVQGHSGLYRDPKTNSIINKNVSEYEEYMKRRKLNSEEHQKIQTLSDEVANMKSDLDEIKQLLRGLTQ
tara:strand:+ start:1739 stop:1957 length:219 start_codon:yes stop_codon:yes gene_type:complete